MNSSSRSSSTSRCLTKRRRRDVSRYLVTKYLGQQPHIGKAAGLDPELLERINKTMGGWPARPGGIEDAMKLVSDEVTTS